MRVYVSNVHGAEQPREQPLPRPRMDFGPAGQPALNAANWDGQGQEPLPLPRMRFDKPAQAATNASATQGATRAGAAPSPDTAAVAVEAPLPLPRWEA